MVIQHHLSQPHGHPQALADLPSLSCCLHSPLCTRSRHEAPASVPRPGLSLTGLPPVLHSSPQTVLFALFSPGLSPPRTLLIHKLWVTISSPRHMVWPLGLSSAGLGVELCNPCGSLPMQHILWLWNFPCLLTGPTTSPSFATLLRLHGTRCPAGVGTACAGGTLTSITEKPCSYCSQTLLFNSIRQKYFERGNHYL